MPPPPQRSTPKRRAARSRANRTAAAAIVVALLVAPVSPGAATVSDGPGSIVWHEPYLQSAATSAVDHDGVEIRWQTMPTGTGAIDTFLVGYRRSGALVWSGSVAARRPTGTDDRVVHVALLDDLAFGTTYQYVVAHRSGGATVHTYSGEFETRPRPGDDTPFVFAAYGDSACACNIEAFQAVQRTIATGPAAFALLLGDNAYNSGTHDELDVRFRPEPVPEATVWRASHIDFAAYGNHDVASAGGAESRAVFGAPTPAVTPPDGEPAGHNYSFEWGSAFFVTFDSNAYHDQDRLEELVGWIQEELATSDRRWKVVFAHHPVGGAPDKPESPRDPYFDVLITALADAGADLLLVGHSHTYSWTYPLRGTDGGGARYVRDLDERYTEGTGVVQVIAGTGGVGLRGGSFDEFDFAARGFSADTDPAAAFGYARVSVSPDALVVDYVSAVDGSVLASFRIEAARRGWAGWRISRAVTV